MVLYLIVSTPDRCLLSYFKPPNRMLFSTDSWDHTLIRCYVLWHKMTINPKLSPSRIVSSALAILLYSLYSDRF